MGAALSYYTVFSLAPLLVIVIAVAGLVFGTDAAQGEITGQLRGLLGDQGAKAVEELLKSANQPSRGLTASIIGGITLIIGATSVFGELQSDLDRVWRAPAAPGLGLWGLVRSRLLSFGMILAIGFLLLVSLVISAALAALGKWWGALFGGWEIVLQGLNLVVSLATITVLFALIYKVLPRVKVAWADVWVGAAVTSLLFTIGKFAIGLYLGKSDVTSGYGAAGSVILLLVWVYYSAQIFLLGAEFTWVFAHRMGSRSAYAEALTVPPPVRQLATDVPARQPVPATTRPAVPSVATATGSAKTRDGFGSIAAGLAIGLLWRLVDRFRGRRRL
jgi:membrane protein